MLTMHDHPWIAATACFAITITLLSCSYLSKSPLDEKKVTAAEDEVYEAVVRDMVTPTHGEAHISQLVFDDAVITELGPNGDIASCEDNARKNLRLEKATLPYNSLADKVYRIFAHSTYDDSLRAATIQDFLEKSCTVGRISQTFHTDLPRTFIAAEGVHFSDWPVEKNGQKSFGELFPGASGIIALSHVGFDATLHEAIVSTSFVCGGLCGSGTRYVLKKKQGRWQVVSKLLVWVS